MPAFDQRVDISGRIIQRVVLRVSEVRVAVEHLMRQIASLEENYQSETRGLEELRNLEGGAKDARRQWRNYSEDLVEGMLSLDKLKDLDSHDRAERKQTIARIEDLLDALDAVKGRLDVLDQQIRKGVQMLDEEYDSRLQALATTDAVSPVAMTPPTSEFWKSVKLTLSFHTRQGQHGYVLSAPLQRCRVDDLNLQLLRDRRGLLITGVCVPSQEAALHMQSKIQEHLKKLPANNLASEASEIVKSLYTSLGSGSCGMFSETVRIPINVDITGIRASFDEDALIVVLPIQGAALNTRGVRSKM